MFSLLLQTNPNSLELAHAMENHKHVQSALPKRIFGPVEQEHPVFGHRKYYLKVKIRPKVTFVSIIVLTMYLTFLITAIDIWGAGVIFISILSSCSPFFSSPDDMTALSEIITLFGTEAIEKVASSYGMYVCK